MPTGSAAPPSPPPCLLAVPRWTRVSGALAAGALVTLLVGCVTASGHPETASYLMLLGFAALTVGLVVAAVGLVPAVLGACWTVLGGLSTVVATGPTSTSPPDGPPPFVGFMPNEVVSRTTWQTVSFDGHSFRIAFIATVLGGVCSITAALVSARFSIDHDPAPRPGAPQDLSRIGQGLVAVGFLGIGAALVRWARLEHPPGDTFASLKSFWNGGAYLLMVATVAVPGFGIWLASILQRGDRPALLSWGAAVTVYLLASVPTGQRGFAIQLVLVVAGVLAWRNRLRLRTVVVVGVVGVAALLVTQAARNVTADGAPLNASQVSQRLEPKKLPELFANQVASFQWTWDVERYRGDLDTTNSFVALALKPIPRRLYPGKSQGFGAEFTAQLFPAAYAQQVGFATPLVAEALYAWGIAGATLVLGLLGLVVATLGTRVPQLPTALQPIAGVAVLWSIFLLLRGDLANAAFIVAAWALSVAAAVVLSRRTHRLESA